jgi:hypothetical protein
MRTASYGSLPRRFSQRSRLNCRLIVAIHAGNYLGATKHTHSISPRMEERVPIPFASKMEPGFANQKRNWSSLSDDSNARPNKRLQLTGLRLIEI